MRTVVRSAALIAFSVACGYAKLILFPYLFFVEIFSVAVFLSGTLIGTVWGIWVGAIARLLFSVANPYGPPHPWILAAQVIGGGVIGALGGLSARWLLPRAGREAVGARTRTAILLAAGLAGTLAYDLITNVAQGIVFGSIPVTLAVAALPTLQHVASNLAIFAVVGNVAFPWLSRHPAVMGRAV
jgi:hypothetical protein